MRLDGKTMPPFQNSIELDERFVQTAMERFPTAFGTGLSVDEFSDKLRALAAALSRIPFPSAPSPAAPLTPNWTDWFPSDIPDLDRC
jgi:hypothetical protein